MLTLVHARGVHRMKYRKKSCDSCDTQILRSHICRTFVTNHQNRLFWFDLIFDDRATRPVQVASLVGGPSRESSRQLRVRIWKVYLMLRGRALQSWCPQEQTMPFCGSRQSNPLARLIASHLHRHSTMRSCLVQLHARLRKWADPYRQLLQTSHTAW